MTSWVLSLFSSMQQAPQGVHLIYRHVKITWLLCIVHSSNIKKLRISPVFFLYFPKKAWGKIDSSIITLKVESTRKGLARWSSIINRWQIFATYLSLFSRNLFKCFSRKRVLRTTNKSPSTIPYKSTYLVRKNGQFEFYSRVSNNRTAFIKRT